ncbi:hypothetical protein EXIGLDRAFT_741898 [Exidia glandulosa HHB12029]|uniref:DNA repair protein RAD5 n=1 Tax=Exidia glandulosa HHB12029 TaxID=1314781 RepID=A0A165DGV5_EXIGL|nr:hypothetical protein EXIGLDRAFT_741898 [Exidia glandulosa HHB12029]
MSSFFDLPDDGDDDIIELDAPPSSDVRSSSEAPLFLDDNDDVEVNSKAGSSSDAPLFLPDSDVEKDDALKTLPSSPSPSTSTRPKNARPAATELETAAPPAKKRRVEPEPEPVIKPPARAYIGEFYIENAYSLCNGKGYMKNGDEVLVERDKPSKPSAPAKGQQTKLSFGKKTKPKVVVNTIVRFKNTRGFELGRLPDDGFASWAAKLMDQGLIHISGTIVDCPDVVRTGSNIVLRVRVYFLPAAWKKLKPVASSVDSKAIINEGQEMPEEQLLRERKNALVTLFKRVGLEPKTRKPKITENKVSTPKGGPRKTELVGEGDDAEEVEAEGEELSERDLSVIYNKAQSGDARLGTMEPPSSFALTLRNYQKQALNWMYSIECGTDSARLNNSMHPLWDEYTFPHDISDTGDAAVLDLTDEVSFYFNSYSGELSLAFPRAERKCRGGILADEMGMGKTIMVSALLHSNSAPEIDPPETSKAKKGPQQIRIDAAFRSAKAPKSKGAFATLIVAPTSLLDQWAKELERSSKPNALKITVWHGANRQDLDAVKAQGSGGEDAPHQIVVTSYGVLASEHAKIKEGYTPPVFEVDWLRVVLDEAHNCKSRLSKTAKAVCALKARRRWALTGTPIVNRLEDLYSLLKFLRYEPWSDFSFFRSFITAPFLAHDPKALEVVQVILESCLLRREKGMKDADGKPIVDLPSKEVSIARLNFSPPERKLYDLLYRNAKETFNELNARHLVGKNYSTILAKLMLLRRAVLHPTFVTGKAALLKKKADAEETDGDIVMDDAFAAAALEEIESTTKGECPVCFDIIQNPVLLPNCKHCCCKDCILSWLRTREEKGEESECPVCRRGPINEEDLLDVVQNDDAELVLRKNDFQSSTKLDALSTSLRELRDRDPAFRAVVFSQFTSFLDLIQIALERDNFLSYRFDGSMNIKKRAEVIEEFKRPTQKPKVLAISLKAGGVGLNLTNAQHVFMMDCWWNASVENQAIDRVHRIGQDKTVYVTHFIIDNTIEERILQIQRRKTAIVKGAFNKNAKEDSESMENLKIMFGD